MNVKLVAVSRKSRWWKVGTSGSLLLGFALIPFPLHPRPSVCGFLWLTGRPCPFCGITRAMSCLMKGEVALALSLHPLSPLVLLALLVMFLGYPSRMVWERAGWRNVSKDSLQFFRRVFLLVFLVYGAWRVCFGELL